jgi:hypothetical protein
MQQIRTGHRANPASTWHPLQRPFLNLPQFEQNRPHGEICPSAGGAFDKLSFIFKLRYSPATDSPQIAQIYADYINGKGPGKYSKRGFPESGRCIFKAAPVICGLTIRDRCPNPQRRLARRSCLRGHFGV